MAVRAAVGSLLSGPQRDPSGTELQRRERRSERPDPRWLDRIASQRPTLVEHLRGFWRQRAQSSVERGRSAFSIAETWCIEDLHVVPPDDVGLRDPMMSSAMSQRPALSTGGLAVPTLAFGTIEHKYVVMMVPRRPESRISIVSGSRYVDRVHPDAR